MTAHSDPGATKIDTKGDDHDADTGIRTTSTTAAAAEQFTPHAGGDLRHDRIRWGAVWTGALTTLSVLIVLQLLFFALGWLDLGVDQDNGTVRAIVSGVLGLVAFFLGGAAAGASALWRRANDGMVNGVVMWAVTVVVVLVLALVGGGALLGSLADVATRFVDLRSAGAGVDVARATEAARETAGWAVLGLGLTMAAAALGGSIGAKLWPGRGRRDADRR
jgi:hypothetical protein